MRKLYQKIMNNIDTKGRSNKQGINKRLRQSLKLLSQKGSKYINKEVIRRIDNDEDWDDEDNSCILVESFSLLSLS